MVIKKKKKEEQKAAEDEVGESWNRKEAQKTTVH